MALLLLALQGAAPPDAGAFIKKFDDLFKTRKLADAVKYYEAHRERFKEDPAFAKDAGRLEAAFDDARGAPFRKTKLRIDFAAGAPGTRVSGPAKLAPGPDGQVLDLTPQGPTPGTLLFLPAGTTFTTGARVWIDVDVWYEGPEGVEFWLDIIGTRTKGAWRARLTVDGLAPGGWRRRTSSFSSFALGTFPKLESELPRDGEALNQIGVIPPQKAGIGRIALRAIHVYEEDKHESGKLELDAPDAGGLTRLHRAALAGDAKKAAELISKGADPRASARGGETALHLAALNGHAAVVEALLAGVKTEDIERISAGRTPLMAAAWAASPKAVKALLGAKANAKAPGAGLRTPLHVVCERDEARVKDQLEIARQLLAAGADPKAKDEMGRSPMDVAETTGFKEAAALLKR